MHRTASTLRAVCGLSCVAFLSVALGACDMIGKKKDSDSTATPAPPPPPVATAPAATAPADTAAALPPAPPAAPITGAPTPVPAQPEWAQAARVDATNAAGAGCEVKQLREWIRVACGFSGTEQGAPQDVNISRPGNRPTDAQKASLGPNTSIIYPFTEGQDLEAHFVWERASRTFTARWPQGTPQPPYVGAFSGPVPRNTDQCDRDADCGAGRQCCVQESGRGVCKSRGVDVCKDSGMYTKCNTDAECRRERSTKSVCQFSSKVGQKICVWDKDESRKTKDDQGSKPPRERPKPKLAR